jgi:squalene-hopene/tetraprenyl-beta-curcumene cyclase
MHVQTGIDTANLMTRLEDAIASSQAYLLSTQDPQGYWWAELESNASITSEAVLVHKIWGTDSTRPLAKVETYLRHQQRDHGGWELYYGDGGELSVTIEAYMALRLLGVSTTDQALVAARAFILERGGISKSRIFTKLHLALIGCYEWSGIPSLPAWVMLLPESAPFTIYEMSSWARGSTVPLLLVMDREPVYDLGINLDELYPEGRNQAIFDLPHNSDWTDVFVGLDRIFKFAETTNFVPLREEGLKAAERWVLERQEATGDWGGIIPAMLNSLLGLKALDYDAHDPIIKRGLAAVDNFAIETETEYRVQPCISPVWDTALVMRALAESGLERNHPALVKGGQWLLEKQILDYGDWNVKNKNGEPGGWAFEFENRFYPDVDDTAVVVMALNEVMLPDENVKQAAITRAFNWVATMQCKPGGWAAFDIDNDQDWLNWLPYGDLKAMIDPNTADVTARVLEMLGRSLNQTSRKADAAAAAHLLTDSRVNRALDYLKAQQESDGSWFGRWGVNYIYGTSGVLAALALVEPQKFQTEIQTGSQWLLSCQNADGGWGETCRSYNDSSLKGQGPSTASQTAWALIGLLAAGDATGTYDLPAIERGVDYLVTTQKNGVWDEDYFTGTGFPSHFYLKYHLYQQHFSLTALARYRTMLAQV